MMKFIHPIVLMLFLVLAIPVGAAPQVQRFLDLEFVTGGVGLEEEQILKVMAADYTLKILVTQRGKFLSDINITILDSENHLLLDAKTDGPLMYANLEPGVYRVEARGFGEHFKRSVNVRSGRQAQMIFRWP